MPMILRRPSLLIALALFLVALLALVGWLQYRWIGEVSRDEHARMQANLQASLAGIARDFDHEVTIAFAQLQMSGELDAQRTAEQWDRWSAAAATPRLVSTLYAVTRSDAGALELQRFRRDGTAFEHVAWPPELAAIRTRIAGAGDEIAPFIEPNAPAIVSRISSLRVVGGNDGGQVTLSYGGAAASTAPRRWSVIALDRRVIETEVLPQLARRWFPAAEYRVTAAPRAVSAPRPVDGQQDFFTIRFEELPSAAMQMARLRPVLGSLPASVRGPLTFRVIESVTGSRAAGHRAPIQPVWTLRATRAGASLEETVTRARRRNLAISFSVLALLAAAIALAGVAAHRAHALGVQQMEFVAAVSHELRTPLATIVAVGDNLSSGIVAPERVREYGAVVRGEGRRLTETIEQVLELARGTLRRGRYALQPVDVAAAIDRAVDASAQALQQSGRELHVSIAPHLPPVGGDAAALARALQNLILNSVKYGDGAIDVDAVAANDVVTITVADRGRGVDRADVPHLFEPFYRGAAAEASNVAGAGLGLAIVERIVDAHAGRASYAPRDGGGALFRIDLPAVKG